MTNCLACHGTGRFVVAYDRDARPSDVRPCPYCGGKGVV